jgi:hypothetical protein
VSYGVGLLQYGGAGWSVMPGPSDSGYTSTRFFRDFTPFKYDAMKRLKPASATKIAETVDSKLRARGGAYATYSSKPVSWDDAERGTVGGKLSCWGSNITDVRLRVRNGGDLLTLRPENWCVRPDTVAQARQNITPLKFSYLTTLSGFADFCRNEKLGRVSARELALIVGNHVPGLASGLRPVTLSDFLARAGELGGYAGLAPGTDLSAPAMDDRVSVRFQAVFLPLPPAAAGEGERSVEFAPEMYNYQTRDAARPRNAHLFCTSQGTAVQFSMPGYEPLFHHVVSPPIHEESGVQQHWLAATQSAFAVGGAQVESDAEAAAAAAAGKASASVIGTRAMGTRFNAVMTLQVRGR